MALRRRGLEARHPPAALEAMAAPVELLELHTALGHLSERQRTAVVLRYFVDLPDHQIAEVLGCRVSTVRSLVHRALRVLRKEMA